VKPALILQHGPTGPPGLLAEWAQARDLAVEIHHTYLGRPWPKLDGRPFVSCLGSRHSPLDRDVPVVLETLELIEQAVRDDVPVLGLCYGGQVLAAVTGGTVERSPEPQHGWYELETDAPEQVPAGPWLEWHYDRFTLPPGATELARTGSTVQAFGLGAHLGVQFHPESTIEIVQGWARADRKRLASLGIDDGLGLLEVGRNIVTAAREAAFALFDAFWDRARNPDRRES
jgi:GMP synthase-like glutamine amidotransferase